MRKVVLPTFIIVATALLILRLFYLQIINDSFKLKSENNAIKIKYDYPERGYIYDRHGALLVANQPSYDIMVVPRDIKKLDTDEDEIKLNTADMATKVTNVVLGLQDSAQILVDDWIIFFTLL